MPEVDVYVMRWADDATPANPVSIFQKSSAELSDPAPDPPKFCPLATFRSSLAASFCLAQPDSAKTLEVARHTSPTAPITLVTAATTCTNVPVDQRPRVPRAARCQVGSSRAASRRRRDQASYALHRRATHISAIAPAAVSLRMPDSA